MFRIFASGLVSLLLALPVWGAQYDTIIRGGTVYDGSGSPGVVADVAISGDRVAAIGDLSGDTAAREIDASGQAVSPGFINMLSWAVGSLVTDGRALSDIKQGVTLEVFGEGWSMGPLPEGPARAALVAEFMGPDAEDPPWTTLGEYLEFLESKGVAPNIASFVGATTLRIHQVGMEDRPPTPEEMANMKALLRQAMEEGAMGLGTALIYPPAFFSTTEELSELAKVVGEYDGRYISHMRSEANSIEESVQELITIARAGGIGGEIYHLKMAGKKNWGKLPAVVKLVEDARAEGLDITANMYTYIAGGTSLSAVFPPWASDGGNDALLERLRDPDTRARIVAEVKVDSDEWENLYMGSGAGEGVLVGSVSVEEMRGYIGKTIAEIAAERGADPVETMVDLVLETDNGVGAAYFMMSEDNVREQIKLPWISFGSDADAPAPEGKVLEQGAHPRTYGNFARLLGKYVREEGVIPLEEAIHKLTAFPAGNLKIRNRGMLAEGYYADVVVFDPAAIGDLSTFADPHQLSVGVNHVFVNGEQVLRDGEHTGATPGRVVRGPGYKPSAAGPKAVSATGLDDPAVVDAFFHGLVGTLMANNNSPSGVITVVKDGEMVFAGGYGYRDLEERMPVDPAKTLFRPGSISKLFTWVAVMQQVEQGNLDLDTNVNDYLTQFQIKEAHGQPITLRDIMTHTPGWEDGGMGYLIISDESRLIPLAEAMERYQPYRINPPGAQTSYSNYGTALAGLIVANVSGLKFEDYLQQYIFEPLGMNRSTFNEPLPEGLAESFATGYAVEAGQYVEKPYELISNFGPAGALASTGTDMARFAMALLNGGELDGRQILRPETVDEMLTRNFSHDDRMMGMALGFYETEQNGFRLVGHGGDTAWFHSDLAIDRENNVAVFTSFSGIGGGTVRSAVVPAFYDRFFPEEFEVPEPPSDFSERAGKYAGAYNFWRRNFSTMEKGLSLFGNIMVAPSQDNSLIITFGEDSKEYVEIENNLFLQKEPGLTLSGMAPNKVAFQEDENGAITGFVMDGLPFMSLQKLPFYATSGFIVPLLIGSLVIFLFVVLRRLYQREQFKAMKVRDRTATRAAVYTAVDHLVAIAALGIALVVSGDKLGGEITLALKIALLFPVIACVVSLWLFYQFIQVWKDGLLASVWARLRYTVVTLAALFMLWFYWFSNILGWQYYS